MKQIERIHYIQNLFETTRFISIKDLLDKTMTSESTLRRDLDVLIKKGILKIECGIVTLSNESINPYFSDHEIYSRDNIEIKEKIGSEAAKLIVDGDTIFLDSSSTVLELAKNIKQVYNLTVVTNDVIIALELQKKKLSDIILIGGILKNNLLIGPMAEQNLESICFSKAFMGAGGITKSGYFTNYNYESIPLRKKIIEISNQVIILSDSSKFEKNAFANMASFSEIDQLIIDYVPEEYKNTFHEANVKITQINNNSDLIV